MDITSFNELFETHVSAPLKEQGFKSKGKSLYHNDGLGCLSLIRLGGRRARPGAISHIVCFRHNFLRDLNKAVHDEFTSEVFAYPFKFLPMSGDFMTEYRPSNLSYDCETIDFLNGDDVLKQLVNLRKKLLDVTYRHHLLLVRS